MSAQAEAVDHWVSAEYARQFDVALRGRQAGDPLPCCPLCRAEPDEVRSSRTLGDVPRVRFDRCGHVIGVDWLTPVEPRLCLHPNQATEYRVGRGRWHRTRVGRRWRLTRGPGQGGYAMSCPDCPARGYQLDMGGRFVGRLAPWLLG